MNVDESMVYCGGDVGICFGNSDEQVKLANGRTFLNRNAVLALGAHS